MRSPQRGDFEAARVGAAPPHRGSDGANHRRPRLFEGWRLVDPNGTVDVDGRAGIALDGLAIRAQQISRAKLVLEAFDEALFDGPGRDALNRNQPVIMVRHDRRDDYDSVVSSSEP
jgi:hypothetical protein